MNATPGPFGWFPAPDPYRPLHVLVADDTRLHSLVLTRILSRSGYTPHCAASGREVLERLRLIPCGLVLMDVHMPDMDGLEATRAIRRGDLGPETARIPIIAITAYSSAYDRDRCLAAGMDGFIPRPFAFATLLGAIRQVLLARK